MRIIVELLADKYIMALNEYISESCCLAKTYLDIKKRYGMNTDEHC